MTKLQLTGLGCADCANKVKEALAKVPGVTEVKVCFKDGVAEVTGDAPTEVLVAAVEAAGYGAEPL